MKVGSHTPGSWKATGVLVKAGCDTITHCGGNLHPIPQRVYEAEANARLIAAAPELLAQLSKMVDFFRGLEGDEPSLFSDSLAVIAKATGSEAVE